MKRILMAAVITGLGGPASAADFSELQGLKAGGVAGMEAQVPAAPRAEEDVVMVGEGDVIITVDRFTAPNDAPMVFALCDSERCHKLQDKGYKDIKAELLESAPAKRTYLIRGLKPGDYSLSGYNDVNGNGRMDTGLFGIPKEPVGFSVLNTNKLGSNPSWDSVRFTVDSAAVSVFFHLIRKFGL